MTTPQDKRGRVLAYGVVLLLAISIVAVSVLPFAESAAAFKQIGAGKKVRSVDTQGYVTWSGTLYFTTTMNRNATGNILTFTSLKLGSSGYLYNSLGFASDTIGVNMTLTQTKQNSIKYTATGAGTQRIWCPLKGEPYDVVGGSLSSWDNAAGVATIDTSGADTVTVSWYGPMSGSIYDSIDFMSSLLLLLALTFGLGAYNIPEYRWELIRFAILMGVMSLLSHVISLWGA